MPTRGKCWSCGEIAFLTAKLLRNKETGNLWCVMICDQCKRFYEQRENINMNDKTCATCKWRSDDFTSVCVNGESEHCADFVSEDDWCEEWEAKDDQ